MKISFFKNFKYLFSKILVFFILFSTPIFSLAEICGSLNIPISVDGNKGAVELGKDCGQENNPNSDREPAIRGGYRPASTGGCGSTDAEGVPTFGEIGCLISNLTDNVVKMLAGLFGASALTLFLYGLVMFIKDADDAKKTQEGKFFMAWGLLALFVMVSVWGIVRMFQSFVGINPNQTQASLPSVCTNPNGCDDRDRVSARLNPLGGDKRSGSGSGSLGISIPGVGSVLLSGLGGSSRNPDSGNQDIPAEANKRPDSIDGYFSNRNADNSCSKPLSRILYNNKQVCGNYNSINSDPSGTLTCTSDWIPFSGNDYRCQIKTEKVNEEIPKETTSDDDF